VAGWVRVNKGLLEKMKGWREAFVKVVEPLERMKREVVNGVDWGELVLINVDSRLSVPVDVKENREEPG